MSMKEFMLLFNQLTEENKNSFIDYLKMLLELQLRQTY